MQRLILSAGALSLIAISQAHGQSWEESPRYCPIGATDCTSSYFDDSRNTESVFVLLLQSLFGSDSEERKHVARLIKATQLPAPRFAPSAAPSDFSGRRLADKRSFAFGADDVSAATRRSNDWKAFVRETGEWGWPRVEIGNDHRSDANNEMPVLADGPRRNEGVPERTNDDGPFDGVWPAAPPATPDIIDQPGTLTPEPSTFLLVATGIPVGFAWLRSRRRRAR